MEKGSHLLRVVLAHMFAPAVLSIAYLSGLNQGRAVKPFKWQCPSLHNTMGKKYTHTHRGWSANAIKYIDLYVLLMQDETLYLH